MEADVFPFPGAGQNCPLPFFLPPHVQIEDDLINGGPCLTWISCKSSSCGEASHTSLLCLLMMLLTLNFLPLPLHTKTWPLCCHSLCWWGVGKDLKALSHTLQKCQPFLLSPSTIIPSSNKRNSLTNPHFKAVCRLEGNVADGKAGSYVCHQLGQVSVLQFF